MSKNLITEKIQQAVSILNEKDIDLWMTFVRESGTMRDPAMEMVVGTNATWQSAFLINRNGDTTAIVGSLEVPNMNMVGTYKNVVGYVQSVKEPLVEYLTKHDPKKIAVNYSINSNLADGLTHGLFLILQKHLEGTPFIERFVSSEEIIASLRGRKSSSEIELMKTAVKHTEEIFEEATKFIAPGKSELEIATFVKERIFERGLGLAWAEDHCPSVFTGPDTAGAHSGPTDRKVEKGHIINMDFGVKYNGYCSDMQRTWYILRDGEDTAPNEVQRGFDVLKTAIQKAKAVIRPGVKGCEVDETARNYITENGYAEYQHGLGHQLGRTAHDGGGGLFPRWERYGNLPFLPIEENQIFTIEPRLFVEGHGVVTMEEEVVVTKDGCEYLTHPQIELILIK
ncbi:MAG: M24 family metallopeptidase [Ignavibacteria bacterium]|nr:M24 family metallopeptidase [Ignavibacteria bacterium]